MLRFTAPDNSKVEIDGTLVIRARRAVAGEGDGEDDQPGSRIDWAIMTIVKEPIEEVAARVRTELPSFTAVTAKDGSRIWFDARQAVGPLPITAGQRQGGAKSSIKIMGYRQYVTETAEQVRAILRAAGGAPP